jgi:hypothetical protein
MTAATINRKIARGFAKVGKKLGYQFNLFRPDNYINPTEQRNSLLSAPMSWSKDEQFKTNPEPTLAQYIIYCDFTVLQVGDVINAPSIARTFIINEINELRGAVSFQASDMFDVLRPIYTPLADVKTSFEPVVTNMPGAVQYTTATSNDAALTSITSSMKSGQSQVEIWTWLPVDHVHLNDVIVVNAKRFIVTSIDSSAVGVKLRALSTKAGT